MEIPPGVETGDVLRVNGRNQVEVVVEPSREFKRQGADVFSTVKISLAQSVLGGTVPVQGINGDLNLTVSWCLFLGYQPLVHG